MDYLNDDQDGEIQDQEWWNLDFEEDVITYIYDRKTKELVTKISGFVPDPHEIGNQYGSGEYRAMIRGKIATGGKTITKDFKCGKSYDQPKQQEPQKLSGFPSGDFSNQIAFGMSQGLKSIVSEFAPILPQIFEMMKPKEPTYGAALESMYSSMNRILESNTKKQMENFSEFQKQIMQNFSESMNLSRLEYEDDDEDEEQEQSPMSILFSMIKPLLQNAMPAILNGSGAEIINGIKTNPLFIQVTSNPAVMKEIESWVLNEFGFDALRVLKELLQ